MTPTLVDLSTVPEQKLVPGLIAKMIHMNNMTVMHVRIEEGSQLPEHSHVHEQVTNIIEGTLEMTVGGNTYTCGPGTCMVIPSNVVHSAKAITPCYVIDTFQPVREDYKLLS